MKDLVDFAKGVEGLLKGAKVEPHWGPGEAEQYMTDVGERRCRLEEIAEQYTKAIIQPRVETLASYFINANTSKDEHEGYFECWFGYCERFPANSKVAFAVVHDVRYENVAVRYDVSMVPLFIRFNEHDRLTFPINELNEDRVADWVETRLLEFLDAYLQIDRGDDDFEDEPVIDPVCGMRIKRSAAATTDSYFGHPYFFCSKQCLEKFEEDPAHFSQIRTMLRDKAQGR